MFSCGIVTGSIRKKEDNRETKILNVGREEERKRNCTESEHQEKVQEQKVGKLYVPVTNSVLDRHIQGIAEYNC